MADLESTIECFAKAAAASSWDVVYEAPQSVVLPTAMSERFPRIPDQSAAFLSRVRRCKHPDELNFFVCVEDYTPVPDHYHWNDMEEIMLSAADGDEVEKVKTFWDSMFPVAYAPWPDYAYLGLSLAEENFGAVYYGFNQYWEEPSRVADSLQDYLIRITAILTGSESVNYVNEEGQECVAREFADFL